MRFEEIPVDVLRPMGALGVYARGAAYLHVLEGLAAYISTLKDPDAELLRLPPVMSRAHLEKSGYLASFPHLLGCACTLPDAAAAIDTDIDWTEGLTASDLALTPAACYPLYPLVAARGPAPAGGLSFDVEAECFRREPSMNKDRLQSFRMREFVRVGLPAEVLEFRERYLALAPRIARDLGLPHAVEVASDPFFGRSGRIRALSQQHRALKFELLVPCLPGAPPTACMSFNLHLEHFGEVWNLRDENDRILHSSCIAFGIDRLIIALFAHHGGDFSRWPAHTRRALVV